MAFLDETGLAELWSLTKGLHDKYYQHWWKRRTFPSVEDVVVGDIVTTETVLANFKASDLYGSAVGDPGNTSKSFTVQYSGELCVDSNGKLQLLDPTTVTTNYSNVTSGIPIANLRGKYYTSTLGDGRIWYASPTASYTRTSYCCWLTEVASVSFPVVPGEWEKNVVSPESNAHPHSGVVDGYQYKYLGVPFDNALMASKIATGSYAGTGKYGESNPCTLTFDFVPKIVFLYQEKFFNYNSVPEYYFFFNGQEMFMANGTSSGGNVLTWDGATVSWYYEGSTDSSGPSWQLNAVGTYYYTAIG